MYRTFGAVHGKKMKLPFRLLIALLIISLIIVLASGCKSRRAEDDDLVDPISAALVFADKYPETIREAHSLINQKIYLVSMEDRYCINGSVSLSYEEVHANGAEKISSSVKNELKEAVSAIQDRLPIINLTYGDDTEKALPRIASLDDAESFTANCSKEGIFRITLNYGAEDAELLMPDETADLEKALRAELGERFGAEDLRFAKTDASVYAEIDGQHGTLSVLEIVNNYKVGFTVDDDITFILTEISRYQVEREGVYFTEKSITMKKGRNIPLRFEMHLPESITAEDYTITFVSSDESVLSVDASGIAAAAASSSDEVTVTVMLMLNDDYHIFNDTCNITVTE